VIKAIEVNRPYLRFDLDRLD